MTRSAQNIPIGGQFYECTDLIASIIGGLVQNSTANGTSSGAIDLAVLVDQCDNVCNLAWGSPNFHLSGIGTVKSYMMQATTLIALFGLYLVNPGTLSAVGLKYPEKIHRNFRAANLLMAISFFVAEFSHLLQNPGIVKRDFIRMLADLQIMQYTIIAYGVFGQTTSYLTVSQLVLGGDNWWSLDLAPPVLSLVYLGLDESRYGDPNGWQQRVANPPSCPNTYEKGLEGEEAVHSHGFEFSCSTLHHAVTNGLFFAYAALMSIQLCSAIMFSACWYGSKWSAPAGEASSLREHVKRHKWWVPVASKTRLGAVHIHDGCNGHQRLDLQILCRQNCRYGVASG